MDVLMKRKSFICTVFILLCAFFSINIHFVYAELSDIKKTKDKHKSKDGACIVIKSKDMNGTGTKKDPYIIKYDADCSSLLYTYGGVGHEEYFKIVGLQSGRRYSYVVSRQSGNSSLMFRSLQNAMPGIRTNNLVMQISRSFRTSIVVAAKGYFEYSLSTKSDCTFNIHLK